jgi:hypothetical protein
MDKGTSFDGDAIEWYMLLHFNFLGSIRLLKNFVDIAFESQGEGYASFSFLSELDYASNLKQQPPLQNQQLTFSDVQWDIGNWDVGNWDGATLTPSVFKLNGSGENFSIILRGSSDYDSPLRFNAAHVHFILRRRIRN